MQKVILQQDETDCAAACLATVARHYGKRIAINRIRAIAGTDGVGTTGLGIVKAARELGLSAREHGPNRKTCPRTCLCP